MPELILNFTVERSGGQTKLGIPDEQLAHIDYPLISNYIGGLLVVANLIIRSAPQAGVDEVPLMKMSTSIVKGDTVFWGDETSFLGIDIDTRRELATTQVAKNDGDIEGKTKQQIAETDVKLVSQVISQLIDMLDENKWETRASMEEKVISVLNEGFVMQDFHGDGDFVKM